MFVFPFSENLASGSAFMDWFVPVLEKNCGFGKGGEIDWGSCWGVLQLGSAEKLVGFVNVRVFFGDERRSGVCRSTMTGGLLGLRSGSYGSLQHLQNGAFHPQPQFVGRKPSKMLPSGSREKERLLPYLFRFLSRRRVGMLILVGFAFLVFLSGFSTVSKGLFLSQHLLIFLSIFSQFFWLSNSSVWGLALSLPNGCFF